jgi:DNA-binding transcriptional MerR regulator
MAESDYVSILEAARRCGVSDKTIQRAIRRGFLPAQYPQPNRCEIAITDLDTFKPGRVQTATKHHLAEPVSGHVQGETEQRLAALEQRVQQLELQIETLLSRQERLKPPRQTKPRERTTGPLPKHLVSLLVFAKQHNVPEQKVLTHVTMDLPLLPAKRGEWTDHDGAVVTLALDAKGRAAFHQLYHDTPPFVACKQCPH